MQRHPRQRQALLQLQLVQQGLHRPRDREAAVGQQRLRQLQQQRHRRAHARLGGLQGGRLVAGAARIQAGQALRQPVLPARGEHQPRRAEHQRQQPEHQRREAGHRGEQHADAGGHQVHARLGAQLLADRVAQVAVVLVVVGARDQQACGHGTQQRRDLRHHAFADGQDGVAVHRVAHRHVLLQHADGQATQQVDEDDDDAGDGVTLHELHRTVQASMQLAFQLQRAAAAAGLVLVDEAGAQVGVDGQLLAGHGVQREARRHLGHPLGALGDDDELHHRDDEEHHQADHQIAARDHLAEGGDDVAAVGVQQDHAGGGDGQRQPEQRGHQQHAGENRELQRTGHVDGDQQQHQPRGDVHGHQQVDQPQRQRQHHQRHDGDDAGHQEQVAEAGDQPFARLVGRGEVAGQAFGAFGGAHARPPARRRCSSP
jgi:hypothetical protein